jgi:hypothetical protein
LRNFARSDARRATLVLAIVGAVALAGCGDDGGSDPEVDGARSQATERLVAFGLEEGAATCLVEELGAEAINETGELSVLVDSDAYRDAAEGCLDAD